MTDAEKVKNILAFLCILFHECSPEVIDKIMEFTPDYLIEKWERYMSSAHYEADWGLHLSVRNRVFNRYCKIHHIQYDDDI